MFNETKTLFRCQCAAGALTVTEETVRWEGALMWEQSRSAVRGVRCVARDDNFEVAIRTSASGQCAMRGLAPEDALRLVELLGYERDDTPSLSRTSSYLVVSCDSPGGKLLITDDGIALDGPRFWVARRENVLGVRFEMTQHAVSMLVRTQDAGDLAVGSLTFANALRVIDVLGLAPADATSQSSANSPLPPRSLLAHPEAARHAPMPAGPARRCPLCLAYAHSVEVCEHCGARLPKPSAPIERNRVASQRTESAHAQTQTRDWYLQKYLPSEGDAGAASTRSVYGDDGSTWGDGASTPSTNDRGWRIVSGSDDVGASWSGDEAYSLAMAPGEPRDLLEGEIPWLAPSEDFATSRRHGEIQLAAVTDVSRPHRWPLGLLDMVLLALTMLVLAAAIGIGLRRLHQNHPPAYVVPGIERADRYSASGVWLRDMMRITRTMM